MKTSTSKKQISLAVACALTLGFAASAARAQNFGPNDSRELWTDSQKAQVWKNGFGECWHSAYGPPPGYNECNPAPLAQTAPAPAPYIAPVAAVAAPKPVYETVTMDANVLFDFDKAVLRPASRDTLDGFISRIKDFGPGTISAVGYADRFGTDGYNQALSERRVASVKAYLDSKGVEPKWAVQSDAKGETQPTTSLNDCTGAKSASTIACLQPDRHVRVVLSGQRIKQQ